MNRKLLVTIIGVLFFIFPCVVGAETYSTCEYTAYNLGTKTFNLKLNIQKSSKYYLEVDKENSYARYDGKKVSFKSLIATKNVTFYKNYDASGTNWIMISKPKCPEAVKYVTIDNHIYILLGDEDKINDSVIVAGGHTYDPDSIGAQTVIETTIAQEKKDNAETINKYKENINNKISSVEQKQQEFVNYGCYDENTYKHTIKDAYAGNTYIVWENSEKVGECKEKLKTLSALVTNLKSDIDYFKENFPKENSTEYENKYNEYKNNVDNYSEFVENKGKDKNDSGSSETDELEQGTEVTGCEVIPGVVRKWINNILKFVRYVALALVIALGALDFMKAAGSGEPDAMKKAGQSFMKRMIAVVILFLLPVIVDFILNMVNIYGVPKDNIECMKNINQ